jgi:hypothetical protein
LYFAACGALQEVFGNHQRSEKLFHKAFVMAKAQRTPHHVCVGHRLAAAVLPPGSESQRRHTQEADLLHQAFLNREPDPKTIQVLKRL